MTNKLTSRDKTNRSGSIAFLGIERIFALLHVHTKSAVSNTDIIIGMDDGIHILF